MENRECPYCHKQVSLRRCSSYFWKGKTPIVMRCNHCHEEIKVLKDPIPFAFWIIGTIIMIIFPLTFTFLYFSNNLLKGILYSLPIWAIVITILVVMALKRMVFAKEKDK